MSRALQAAAAAAESQRNMAQQHVRQQQRIECSAQSQLAQLQQYAQTTYQRWGMQPGSTVQPEVLHHFGQFMARLEHAIGLQTQVIEQQQRRSAQATQALQHAQLRLMALQRVIAQRQTQQKHQQMRREQQATDERAALQWRKT